LEIYKIFLVFVGSGFGGVLRYTFSQWIISNHPDPTLIANMLACFILGIISVAIDQHHILPKETKLLIIVGFCGGLSTFSSFTFEILNLTQKSIFPFESLIYCILSLTLSMASLLIGMYTSRIFL